MVVLSILVEREGSGSVGSNIGPFSVLLILSMLLLLLTLLFLFFLPPLGMIQI